MSGTYPDLDAYNADVIAARAAYADDMAVQDGYCASCKQRKKDGQHRRCWTCRHTAASTRPSPASPPRCGSRSKE